MEFPLSDQVEQAQLGQAQPHQAQPGQIPGPAPAPQPVGQYIHEDAYFIPPTEYRDRLFARQIQRFYASGLEKPIRGLIEPEDIENARNLEPSTGPMYCRDGTNWPDYWMKDISDVFLQELESFRRLFASVPLPSAVPLAVPDDMAVPAAASALSDDAVAYILARGVADQNQPNDFDWANWELGELPPAE
ncbi:hypothetical protein FLAG1_08492 [Fusarium langsethiae]|uniref:Uncharacterized protein n=1 Tax=Fusarium langsethiae TaxID=179993 RepID=A0A0M9ERZ4_FUSLA|nr:hypothetical protein FLAG1_08492 [Fusarium langsethiae]GKU05614.1 unnamed protein product [Fusarium langsethiae]